MKKILLCVTLATLLASTGVLAANTKNLSTAKGGPGTEETVVAQSKSLVKDATNMARTYYTDKNIVAANKQDMQKNKLK